MACGEGVDLGFTPEGLDVYEGLKDWLKALRDRGVKVRCAVVIGSRARGEWRPHSDTDVLIVVEEDVRIPYLDEGMRIGVEARVYTAEGLLRALSELRLTPLEAGDHGIPIYDDGFWKLFKEEFERVKARYGLERIDIGWRVREKPFRLRRGVSHGRDSSSLSP